MHCSILMLAVACATGHGTEGNMLYAACQCGACLSTQAPQVLSLEELAEHASGEPQECQG